MKSTTEQRLQTNIHSDTSPPNQLIKYRQISQIPSLLDTYLRNTELSKALPLHKTFNI